MSEKIKDNKTEQNNQEQMALDDGRRVKVLSPGLMVFKRFIRNRLAIAGICILIFMFLFSFLGGLISPYRQDQVFYKIDSANKEYAGAVVNTDYRFVTVDGKTLSTMARATFNSQVKGKAGDSVTFTADNNTYTANKVDENFYIITSGEELGTVALLGKIVDVQAAEGKEISAELNAAAADAAKAGQTSFELDGAAYSLTRDVGKNYKLGVMKEVALATMLNVDTADPQYSSVAGSYEFRRNCETAMHAGETSFTADGVTYTLEITSETDASVTDASGNAIANVSNIIVNPVTNGVILPADYKDAVADAITNRKTSFEYVNANGETEKHTIQMRGSTYIISTIQQTHLIDMYAEPSAAHLLGTDDHGMDVLTRLMYGGRISLLVGFIVMILENIIGIIIGGISGYFGGWVDTLLMRFVDLFNSIPYYPMMIIAGAIMDSFEVDPYLRLYMMMAIMGIMGWTGVARVVRGQILSLREQDFMVATEATGIKVSRRIFRHLVPNVMPLLIVQATMGLGSIILTEATLSFLGLGIKYPLASWGTIINSASNIYVMTNCWYLWIPAGLLIVLTVLGFNFVGDGLRDAFDPKMKR